MVFKYFGFSLFKYSDCNFVSFVAFSDCIVHGWIHGLRLTVYTHHVEAKAHFAELENQVRAVRLLVEVNEVLRAYKEVTRREAATLMLNVFCVLYEILERASGWLLAGLCDLIESVKVARTRKILMGVNLEFMTNECHRDLPL